MKKCLLSLLILFPLVACNGKAVPLISDLKASVSGHFSDIQLNYLRSEDYSDTTPYNGNMSVSDPLPVRISWQGSEGPYRVELLPKTDPTSAVIEPLFYETNDPFFDFYNPQLNKEYEVYVSNGNEDLQTSFIEKPTVSGPRNLKVDGVENFRDIGGWGKFVNGEYKTYMKQGMVYRSGRYNADKADPINVTITDSGIKEMNDHLKIKSEIDLRRTSINEVGGLTDKSVLGDSVTYYSYPMAYGGNNILTFKGKLNNDDYTYDNPAMIKQVLSVFGDKNNYPIVFHCSIGKDRTGCIAYLLEGLLGFDQETMYRDYMFTNFADAGMCKLTDITDRYGKTINEYTDGETLQEKTFNYLKDVIGIPEETLNNIINILKA